MYEWYKQVQIIIDEIDLCIKAHDDDALMLKHLSDKLGYSEFYISRKFKEISGMQFRDYLRFRRLAFALKEIRDTETGILDIAVDKVVYLLQRIFGLVNDHGSGDAHRRYYTEYFNVLDNSSIPQILFGYGIGCSGYPFTEMFGQYGNHASWAVESDIMNILLSRGIFGFVLYYGMLIFIAIKGFKISYKYLCTTIILIIGGITYNIQFDWLFLINILMLYCVNNGINWFDSNKSTLKGRA